MAVSNSYSDVNFCGQNQPVNLNRAQLPSFVPHSKYARQMASDVFIKLDNQYKTEAANQIETLFPDRELNKIFDKIVQDYGIENPPEFIIEYGMERVAASYNQEKNIVKFNPRFINDLNKFKKMYVEFENQNGTKISGYTPDPNVQGKIGFTINESTYKSEKEYLDKKGITTKLVPYNDDDKRKYIIFVMAHELRHALQAQVVNQSEGLGMYSLLKEKEIKGTDNLIAKKLIELTFDQKYQTLEWSKYQPKIKYEKGSKGWEIGNAFYNASINYVDAAINSDQYHNNITELDANNIAEKYLEKHYGGFDELLRGDRLNTFLEKVTS